VNGKMKLVIITSLLRREILKRGEKLHQNLPLKPISKTIQAFRLVTYVLLEE